MLDNSFGDWSEFYEQGAEATWVKRINQEDFYLRYMGKLPKLKVLNELLNRGLNSKFQKTTWKYHLISGSQLRTECKKISDSVVQVNCNELWSNITKKTINALDFALQNFEFDFIVRGNSSLYIDPNSLEKFLETNKNLDYAGPVAGGKKFVAGWCIILSRKAAQIVVDDFRKSDSLFFDDEAIGFILARNHIAPLPLKHVIFDHVPTANGVKREVFNGTWIWRFKTDLSGNRISVPAMKLVETISAES